MDKINSRIAQVYGYAVCFICVVVILAATHEIIDSAFNYSNPVAAGGVYGRFGPLTSYEGYRMAVRQQTMMVRGPDGRAVTSLDSGLTDTELRKNFESEREQQIGAAKFRALRRLVSGVVFLLLASVMYLLHWRWIRRANREPSPA